MSKHTIFDERWAFRCKLCGLDRMFYSKEHALRYARRFHNAKISNEAA